MTKNRTNNPLGRGLADLFADKTGSEFISNSNRDQNINEKDELFYINVSSIKSRENQLRKFFDYELLNELADSIRENGVIQPIILKQKDHQGYYELIAGERRWRAAILVGLKKIPAIIKDIDKNEAFLYFIIENVQRANLSSFEEAEIYKKLINKNYNQHQIATLVNKSRSHIFNLLRLNNLPESLKKMLHDKLISIEQVELLLDINNSEEIANEIIEKELNLQQTENLIMQKGHYKLGVKKNIIPQNQESNLTKVTNSPEIIETNNNNEDLSELEKLLAESLKTKVKITNSQIILDYEGLEDLDRLIEFLMK